MKKDKLSRIGFAVIIISCAYCRTSTQVNTLALVDHFSIEKAIVGFWMLGL